MARRYVNGQWIDDDTGSGSSAKYQGTGQPEGSSVDWMNQMQDIMGRMQNREPFKFDLDKNALYQQYKNQYVLQGQKAMADTMGQAAQLTGGYANSYAQNVGQQAYDDYLTKLNAIVPEIYAQERSAYDKEGDELMDRYNLAANMYGLAYNRDRDALADQRYQDELAYARERDALADQRYQDELAYSRQQSSQSDARSYATYLLQMGITPTADQLAAAGISPEQAAQIRNYYSLSMTGGGSGSGGGGSDGYRYTYDPGKVPTYDPGTVPTYDPGTVPTDGPGNGGGGGEYYDELRTWLIQDMNKAWTARSAAAWNERLNNARGKTISEEQYMELKRLIANELGAYNL